jgi:SAM-dependent methyltransferase
MSAKECRRRETCRLCGSRELELVLPLPASALADAYVSADRADQPQQTYPLDICMCRDCAHVQLVDVVDPESLFGDYIYTSSSSPGLVEHFAAYANAVWDELGLRPGSLAADIGSNDGTLLRFLAERGMRVVGVDPAREIAAQATAAGIPTRAAQFGVPVAEEILAAHGPAQLITANNVYAHVDDLGGVTDGIHSLLDPEGAFVFEVSYLRDLIDNLVFDSIYHEHLCYHSVAPLRRFLHEHGLELFDVQSIPTKGGSIRGFAQPLGGPRSVQPSVAAYLEQERRSGLDRLETLHGYARRIWELRDRVREQLARERAAGSRIMGFGASATSTTLTYAFGLDEFVEAIVDERPARQGLLSPGHHLPVVGPEVLSGDEAPDLLVMLAWRFADPILRKHAAYLDRGGRVLIPLPEVREVTERPAERAAAG